MGIILIQFTCRPDNILVAASAQTFMQSIRDRLQSDCPSLQAQEGLDLTEGLEVVSSSKI